MIDNEFIEDEPVVEEDQDEFVYMLSDSDTPITEEIIENEFLSKEFVNYTVTEGFLLLLTVIFFIYGIAKILGSCFKWLR